MMTFIASKRWLLKAVWKHTTLGNKHEILGRYKLNVSEGKA